MALEATCQRLAEGRREVRPHARRLHRLSGWPDRPDHRAAQMPDKAVLGEFRQVLAREATRLSGRDAAASGGAVVVGSLGSELASDNLHVLFYSRRLWSFPSADVSLIAFRTSGYG